MTVLEAVRARRSIRDFERRAIPDPILDDLILALRWAPSSGNLQRRRFHFVRNAAKRRRLATLAWEQEFIAQAPLAIVASADHRIERDYGQEGVAVYCKLDVAAAIQNLLLVAHEHGLGTCWVGAMDAHAVSELLGLPRYLEPLSIVAVGYPAEEPEPPPRIRRSTAVTFVD